MKGDLGEKRDYEYNFSLRGKNPEGPFQFSRALKDLFGLRMLNEDWLLSFNPCNDIWLILHDKILQRQKLMPNPNHSFLGHEIFKQQSQQPGVPPPSQGLLRTFGDICDPRGVIKVATDDVDQRAGWLDIWLVWKQHCFILGAIQNYIHRQGRGGFKNFPIWQTKSRGNVNEGGGLCQKSKKLKYNKWMPP